MVLNIMMTVAQWERETIVERTRAAMAFKRSRGERISGRLPYGSDLAADGRTLVANPAELEVLARIRARLTAGSGRARSPGAERPGRPDQAGRPWSHSTVQSLLCARLHSPPETPMPPKRRSAAPPPPSPSAGSPASSARSSPAGA